MKLRLRKRDGYIHSSDPRKHFAYPHTFYDCLNPESLCEHLKYREYNVDGLKLYYVGWFILYGDESCFCVRDVKYCPYCGEKLEVEIV